MNQKAPSTRLFTVPAPQGVTVIFSALSLSLSTALGVPSKVDTELLLLVDVSGSVSNSEFDFMLGAYGRAMSSSAVLDAIQSGYLGKIATSVVFWSSAKRQAVGVGWMEVSDLASARSFSSRIQSAARPWSGGQTAIGSAIAYGTTLFGTETGAPENGFSSVTQIIDVAGDGIDNATGPRVVDRSVNVRRDRDVALKSGIDMINGLTINDPTGTLNLYYQQNVIGGSIPGEPAFVIDSPNHASLAIPLTAPFPTPIRQAYQPPVPILSPLKQILQ